MVRSDLRAELARGLSARREEIEQSILARVHAIADPVEASDPAYAPALRVAVSAALDHGIRVTTCPEETVPPVPVVLLNQARLAARNGVSLDTVLRRYFAGYALLWDFLVAEAEGSSPIRGGVLKNLHRAQAAAFDRMIEEVSGEYRREAVRRESSEERLALRIERLLAGEMVHTSDLSYGFDGWHVGLVAVGSDVTEAVRALADALDAQSLMVSREDLVWAWLGSRRRVEPAEIERSVGTRWASAARLAIGEPGEGMTGWRLTHRQARAALSVALRDRKCVVRYADVSLLASMVRDDLLTTSLHRLYLEPLERERDGGEGVRRLLRAYFSVGCNVTATAAALAMNRNTVTRHLRGVEERLGRTLMSCAPDLDLALRWQALGESG